MRVSVTFEGKSQSFEGEATTIEDVLRNLGINTESIIARRGDIVVPIEERAVDGEEIELIKIFSGG